MAVVQTVGVRGVDLSLPKRWPSYGFRFLLLRKLHEARPQVSKYPGFAHQDSLLGSQGTGGQILSSTDRQPSLIAIAQADHLLGEERKHF